MISSKACTLLLLYCLSLSKANDDLDKDSVYCAACLSTVEIMYLAKREKEQLEPDEVPPPNVIGSHLCGAPYFEGYIPEIGDGCRQMRSANRNQFDASIAEIIQRDVDVSSYTNMKNDFFEIGKKVCEDEFKACKPGTFHRLTKADRYTNVFIFCIFSLISHNASFNL